MDLLEESDRALIFSSLIAQHVATTGTRILIDCFAGVGGNTIAFAKSGKWDIIIAIEESEAVMKCAKHNGEIYGVANQISWCLGDSFDVLNKYPELQESDPVIFASPPWGGKFIHLAKYRFVLLSNLCLNQVPDTERIVFSIL